MSGTSSDSGAEASDAESADITVRDAPASAATTHYVGRAQQPLMTGSASARIIGPVEPSRFNGVVRQWDSTSKTGFLTCTDITGDVFLSGTLIQVDLLVPGETVTFSLLEGVGELRKCHTAVGVRRLVVSVAHGVHPRLRVAPGAVPARTVGTVLEALRGAPAAALAECVATHVRATDMSAISSGSTSGFMGQHAAQAARRRQFAENVATCTEAQEFVRWYFEQLLRTLASKIHAAPSEQKLREAEKSAMIQLHKLQFASDTFLRFQRVLEAMCLLVGMPEMEQRLLLSDVSIALSEYRTKQLEASISSLPPFQPSFVLDDRPEPKGPGAHKFAYIVGWLLFKLRGRTSAATGSSSARDFVLALVQDQTSVVDPSTGRQQRHVVPREEAVRFATVVERLIAHLLDGYIEALGSALLAYVKASVLSNLQVQAAWGRLVDVTGAVLDETTSRALLLLWVQYYMKSRQKEFLRCKGWLPKPQPTLRAALRGKASVHADRDKPSARPRRTATQQAPAPAPLPISARTPPRPVTPTERGSQSRPTTIERLLAERPAMLHPRAAPGPTTPSPRRSGARRIQLWSPASAAAPSVSAETPLDIGACRTGVPAPA